MLHLVGAETMQSWDRVSAEIMQDGSHLCRDHARLDLDFADINVSMDLDSGNTVQGCI